MRLDQRQFDLTALAILAAVLAHSAHLPIWVMAVVLLALGGRWYQRWRRPNWGAVPAMVRLPLSLALPVAVIAEYGNIFGREPGSALAVGMLALKLSETERPRDLRTAITFACFVLMAALLFEQSLIATGMVAVALLPQLMALQSLEMPPASTYEAPASLAGTVRHALPAALLTLLAAVPLAMVAFLFLPRLSEPLWGAPGADSAKTGMSDSMSPGGLGELLIDDSPAFRVNFIGGVPPAPSQRYWRGLALWRYDGATWTGLDLGAAGNADSGLEILSEPIEYELTMEPTHQHWLFPLDLPVEAPDGFARNRDFSLVSANPITTMRQYHLRSALSHRMSTLSAWHRDVALRLPAGFNPRTAAMGAQWREQYRTPEKIVQAALALFRGSFSYTLSPPPLGRDFADDFLFDTRAGYCEHFSSAFTTLMRAAGVPARVIVGYQGGYWNAAGEYLVIRQSDAHAWSEVWLDGRGWVRIDPTAAVSPDRVERGSRAASAADASWYSGEWALALRNRWDLVNRMWSQLVIKFDLGRQQGLLTRFGIERADWRQLAIAFAVCGSLLLLAGLLWALRRDRINTDPLDQAYQRLCRRLARAGVARDTAEGPLDYLARLRQLLPHAAVSLEPLLHRYIDLRYMQAAPDRLAVRAFAAQVRRIRVRRRA